MEDPIVQDQSVDKKKGRGRAKDTLFRVTIRNQIDMISIADNKANLIISINTIIISLIVAILGSGIKFSEWIMFTYMQITIPLTILMVACLISAVYSILAAKPRIIKKGTIDDTNSSVLFFGNFTSLSMEDFLTRMDEVLDSGPTCYRNLTIDMYNYGQILSRKYRLLGISYLVFLIGMVGCVTFYLIIFIASGGLSEGA